MKAPTANPENGTSLRPKSDEPLPNVLSVYWRPHNLKLKEVPGKNISIEGPMLIVGSKDEVAAQAIQETIEQKFRGRLKLLACCASSND